MNIKLDEANLKTYDFIIRDFCSQIFNEHEADVSTERAKRWLQMHVTLDRFKIGNDFICIIKDARWNEISIYLLVGYKFTRIYSTFKP